MYKSKKTYLIIWLIFLISLVALSIWAKHHNVSQLDILITQNIQKISFPYAQQIMIFISWFGYSQGIIFTYAVFGLILGFQKKWRQLLFINLTSLNYLVSSLLKLFIDRARPTSQDVLVYSVQHDHSFPSGHVTHYTVLCGFLIYLIHLSNLNHSLKKILISINSFFIIGVGLSRIYLGQHWFTDVLGGYLLGAIILLGLIYIYNIKKSSKNFS